MGQSSSTAYTPLPAERDPNGSMFREKTQQYSYASQRRRPSTLSGGGTTGATSVENADNSNADRPSTMRLGYRTMKIIAPYYWPRGEVGLRVRVVITVLLIIASKFVNLFVPQMYQNVIDAASPPSEDDGSQSSSTAGLPYVAGGYILLYGVLRLISGSTRDLRETIFLKVQNAVTRHVALDAFWHLLQLSLNFHLTRNTGALMRTMDRGKTAIGTMMTMVGFSILPLLLELLMTCALMLSQYGGWYAFIVLVTITGYIAFTLAVTEWRTKFRRGMNDKDNETNNKALDAVINYETVKYFTAETTVLNRYDESLIAYFVMTVKTQVSLAFLNFGQAIIITAGLTLCMGLAAAEVVAGTKTIGELVAINAYILQLYTPLNWLGTSYRMIVNAVTDLEKLFDLFDEVSDVEDPIDPVPLVISDKSSADVEFRNVTFSYPRRGESDAVPVLNGLSFVVPAGHTVALVGHSGSGKTTIGRLLCRFYDASSGSILVGGTNIKSVTQRDLRSHIGVVPQDTVLFNESIRFNIEFGAAGATPGKRHMSPEDAAHEAAIGEFIEGLPDGWDTIVGERGLRLSGGEKQRIAIARTFVKDPEILILDEATSALDSKSEREIQDSLRHVSRGRTTIVIAHRLSTIVDADMIIVLKDGRVLEQGKHSDLVSRSDSEYAQMWHLQQQQEDGQSKTELHDNEDSANLVPPQPDSLL